jgi:hypothetical protein
VRLPARELPEPSTMHREPVSSASPGRATGRDSIPSRRRRWSRSGSPVGRRTPATAGASSEARPPAGPAIRGQRAALLPAPPPLRHFATRHRPVRRGDPNLFVGRTSQCVQIVSTQGIRTARFDAPAAACRRPGPPSPCLYSRAASERLAGSWLSDWTRCRSRTRCECWRATWRRDHGRNPGPQSLAHHEDWRCSAYRQRRGAP